MADGRGAGAGAAARADGAARIRALTHAGVAVHHRPLRPARPGHPRPPERRAARDHRLVGHGGHRHLLLQRRVFRRAGAGRDAVRRSPGPVPRVLGGRAAGNGRRHGLRAARRADPRRRHHARPRRADRRDGGAHLHRLPVRRPGRQPQRGGAVRDRRQRQHQGPGARGRRVPRRHVGRGVRRGRSHRFARHAGLPAARPRARDHVGGGQRAAHAGRRAGAGRAAGRSGHLAGPPAGGDVQAALHARRPHRAGRQPDRARRYLRQRRRGAPHHRPGPGPARRRRGQQGRARHAHGFLQPRFGRPRAPT